MKSKGLTDLFIRKLKEPGVYCDRDGLRLQVTRNRNTESLSKSWLVFPAFDVRDVQIRELTSHVQDGVQPGATIRETAQFTARLLPSSHASSVAQCAGFSRLLAEIRQPATFDARYVGTQQTIEGSITMEWRLEHLHVASQ